MTIDLRDLQVAVVSTFPPTRCGVAKFSEELCRAWRVLAPNYTVAVNRIITASDLMAPSGWVDTMFDPSSPAALRSVARRLDRADVVLVHHEYGIFGPRHGQAVLTLVQDVRAPVVSALHTVLPNPSAEHCAIVEALAGNGPLVVATHTARRCLIDTHRIDPDAVEVINHGTSWLPVPTRPGPRRKLVSWGLLGPGKGIERALEALARVDLDPPVTYDVVGQTHPRVRERQGERYRHSLADLTRRLGMERRVRFVDRYLPDDELRSTVSDADLVILPYDDTEQMCSGTLVDALALGRPVVATAFPHARELLESGGGVAVEPSPDALAAAIAHLLEDDAAYRQATLQAGAHATDHSWEKVSVSYADVLHRARAGVGVG